MKERYVFSYSLWDLAPATLGFFYLSVKLYDNDDAKGVNLLQGKLIIAVKLYDNYLFIVV